MATIVPNPPRHLGSYDTEDEARREAAKANDRRGGPGFFVENWRDGLDTTPHAYTAEESDGRWTVTLTAVPGL